MAEVEHADAKANGQRWTPEEESSFLNKLDKRVVPILSIMYLFSFLDRINIGNVKVANNDIPGNTFEESLGLEGIQFNILTSFFFIPYIVFELPSNVMLKIVGPKAWLSRIMVSWGIIATCQAACSNFGSFLACRLLLGAAEAGFFPGMVFYLTFWYQRFEMSLRLSTVYAVTQFVSAWGGFFAKWIALLNGYGGLKGWQWILVIEGIPSVLVGVLAYFILPKYPHSNDGFLTDREQFIATQRLPRSASRMDDETFNVDDFKKTIADPILLLFCLAALCVFFPGNGTNFFRPSIIAGLGWSGDMANLMSTWPGIAGAVFDQYWGWQSDKLQERPLHILFCMACGALGSAFLVAGQIQLWHPGLRYFFLFIIALNGPVIPLIFVYRANLLSGSTAIAVATAVTTMAGNVGALIAPFAYPNAWGPLYIQACWMSFASYTGGFCAIALVYIWEIHKSKADPICAAEHSTLKRAASR
ncbi:MFS general substrate transporter [Gonapodya prolifera JEL478]|uniref:MFS general substrate transporter n=1 Tax=Gonapodya prolifera (strain JEL478) TaxID=1344416 RepID=A0A139AM23_GONPJ|nr:MFS general substrate transporter [Gonapodya prolifera JEL478]|eukprot:KXS17827.1 MFS general substrate transporter [Gonapodya prolifera JEL478]